MPFCANCGRPVSDDAIFCPNCGRNLRSTAPQQRGPSYQGGIGPNASTAKTLALVAIIVQLVFFIIGVIFASFFFAILGAFSAVSPATTSFTFVQSGTTFTGIPTSSSFQVGGPLNFFGIFAFVFGIMFVVSIIWIVLDYLLVYRNLSSSSTVASAKTPAIVLGIIQLVSGGVLPGILLIAAYLKIEDSLRGRM